MRANTKGGVTPRDRRLDRRKVAIAAIAALFLFAATPAKAGIVEMIVDPAESFMSISQDTDISILFGLPVGSVVIPSVPQVAGSDTAGMFGNMYVDLGGGGSIGFGLGGTITIANTDGGAGYAPFDPVASSPGPNLPPPVGVTTPANYGLFADPGGTTLNLSLVHHGEFGTILGPGRPLTPTGGGPFGDETVFDLFPGVDFWLGTGGRIAFTSLLGSDTGDIVGDPIAAFGTALGGFGEGTWDPTDTVAGGIPHALGTLTILIASSFTIGINVADPPIGDDVFVTFAATGVIVATPNPVPEPSSIVLLGFGVVGFVACGWRLRKRRRA